MAAPQPVDPVKLLVAILWSEVKSLETALERLQHYWGEIDFMGPDRPFDVIRPR